MSSVRHHPSELDTDGGVERSDSVTLVSRVACPACGETDHHPVWRDRFDADGLRRWWNQTGYEVDVASVLAGEWFELVRCAACSMRYQRRVLADDDLGELYSSWISPAQAERCVRQFAADDPSRTAFDASRHAVGRLLTLRRAVEVRSGEAPRLLDFGCGDGGFVRLAAGFGFDAHGVDFSSSRRTQAERGGVELVSDVDQWHREERGTVDAVTMIEVLEHLVDPVGALRNLTTVLEPGGVLLVEVPDCSGIDSPSDFGGFNYLNPLEHVNAFTPETLEQLCARAGFVPLRRGPVFVTASLIGAARAVASSMLRQRSTRRYFRLAA
ncbi:MAG: class I SAM-dependent methyltransferase [Acidimicrobiales bacterium]